MSEYVTPMHSALISTRRLRASASTSPSLVYQPQRHDQRHIARRIIPPHGLHGGGALRGLEGQPHLVGGHVFEDFEQIHRVESDLERLALIGDRELVLRF